MPFFLCYYFTEGDAKKSTRYCAEISFEKSNFELLGGVALGKYAGEIAVNGCDCKYVAATYPTFNNTGQFFRAIDICPICLEPVLKYKY